MITKDLLFSTEEYIELFMPDGIEFIHDILVNIGHYRNNDKSVAKINALKTIEILCDLQLIEVFKWGDESPDISKANFTKEELITFLDSVWYEGLDYPEFYRLPMFVYKKWYLDALEEKGLTITTYWKTFVKDKIGNLEEWIEEVRPK